VIEQCGTGCASGARGDPFDRRRQTGPDFTNSTILHEEDGTSARSNRHGYVNPVHLDNLADSSEFVVGMNRVRWIGTKRLDSPVLVDAAHLAAPTGRANVGTSLLDGGTLVIGVAAIA
jgi:hypothetical protein